MLPSDISSRLVVTVGTATSKYVPNHSLFSRVILVPAPLSNVSNVPFPITSFGIVGDQLLVDDKAEND